MAIRSTSQNATRKLLKLMRVHYQQIMIYIETTPAARTTAKGVKNDKIILKLQSAEHTYCR